MLHGIRGSGKATTVQLKLLKGEKEGAPLISLVRFFEGFGGQELFLHLSGSRPRRNEKRPSLAGCEFAADCDTIFSLERGAFCTRLVLAVAATPCAPGCVVMVI